MRGTERVVKTIEERPGEKGGAFFNGKEGRDDFRKTSFWLKGDGGIRKTFFNGKEGRVGFRKKVRKVSVP